MHVADDHSPVSPSSPKIRVLAGFVAEWPAHRYRRRGAEMFAVGRHGIGGFIGQASPLGELTRQYWSPSVLWTIDLVVFVSGLGFVIAAVNAAMRITYAMGRDRVLPGR